MLGRTVEAVLKRSGTEQVGLIKLRTEGTTGRDVMEMSFNGISADQLAGMRVRRILPNEQPVQRREGSPTDQINRTMIEHFVMGHGFLKAKESPFPQLFRVLADKPRVFLSVSRLAAVMYLCLSDAIETIIRLDLSLKGKALTVDFSGRRPRRFMNVEPPVIDVRGTLEL